jgi:isopentenyl-diphosphate delta-isomerase
MEASIGLEVIATGGIRNGVDVARGVAIGADCAGMAGSILKAATNSAQEVIKQIEAIIHELKVAMFLTQSMDISDLQKREVVISGRTWEWMAQIAR